MKLKIMTFNVQHCLDYINQKIDFDLFAKTISDIDPDICGLNEIRGRGPKTEYTAQAETLAALTDMHCIFGLACMVGGTSPYGNAVLSKTPIISSSVTPIPEVPDAPRVEPRSVLRIKTTSGLVVYQTHFGLSPEEHKNASDTVYDLLSKETGPAILMGDFNVMPDNPVIKNLQCDANIISTDPLLEGQLTFPSDNPDRKIDYIFAKNCNVLSAKVLPLVKSDHRPIVAEIEI